MLRFENDVEIPGGQELLYRGCIARRVLPLRLHRCWCCCCCLYARFLPRSLLLIRDWTHLVLVLSLPVSVLLTAACIVIMCSRHSKCWSKDGCFPELVAWLYCILCVVQFSQLVNRFEQHLINREQEVRAHRDMKLTSYSCMITDMNDTLSQSSSTESSATIAENSFDTRSRDFKRFLEKVRTLCANQEMEDSSEAELLLSQFKVFVINWLQIISETSVDPISSPLVIVHPDVITRQTSMTALVDVMLEKLQVADLCVISSLRDSHEHILRRCQRMVTKQIVDAEASCEGPRTPWLSRSVSSDRSCPSWIIYNWAERRRCCSQQGRSRFPKVTDFLCIRLEVLSQEHMTLLIVFGLGWIAALFVTFSLEAWMELSLSFVIFVFTLFVQLCNWRLIISFEDLHTIRQLQDEAIELGWALEEATHQNMFMRTCWNQVAKTTDVWLYRTIPCLDLYRELHDGLEDFARGDMVIFLTEINRVWGEKDKYLLSLDVWMGSSLAKEEKQRLGRGLGSLCAAGDFARLLTCMQNMFADGPMHDPEVS